MKKIRPIFAGIALAALILLAISSGQAEKSGADKSKSYYTIVTSDTIMSSMAVLLLPPDHYQVEAILPSGQCPGHYDIRLSDIEKIKKADLVIVSRGLPFLNKVAFQKQKQISLDANGRNWMTPDSYIHGLNQLADTLFLYFPKDKNEISKRKAAAIKQIGREAGKLKNQARQAGLTGKPVIASTLQKEPLEWMGFRVVGEYGRPESMSAKTIVSLLRTGRELRIAAVVDNLQSGPDAGKNIAETLGSPHVVLSNFPAEQGYLATLQENINAVLKVAGRK